MAEVIKKIADYTRLCRELSEIPYNAEIPEAYEPIRRRRQELKEQIEKSKKKLEELLKNGK